MKTSMCPTILLLVVVFAVWKPVQAAELLQPVREAYGRVYDVAALKARAEKGDPSAQTTLAELYYSNQQGLATNRVEAYKWAVVAASQGHKDAKHVLAEFDVFITGPEKAEGKRQAEAYLEQRKAGGSSDGHTLKLLNTPVSEALQMYKTLAKEAGIQVVAASQVDRLAGGTITAEFSGSTEAAMKRIGQVLLEQAAVIVTPLDGKRVSLTFNDRLASEQKLAVVVLSP
jgi:TPR repeat protein